MHRKPLFDTIRRLLGRGFSQQEVATLDAAIDTAIDQPLPSCRTSAPDCAAADRPRRISAEGIALIKRFEGCARVRRDGLVEAYPDPGTGDAPWTIGWGATGPDIGPGTVWTRAQCDGRLLEDIARHALDVDRALGDAPTTQHQFDALVSFHYNTGAIRRATLTARHCSGDYGAAVQEFARWTQAGGRILRGLVTRRDAEAALYAQ